LQFVSRVMSPAGANAMLVDQLLERLNADLEFQAGIVQRFDAQSHARAVGQIDWLIKLHDGVNQLSGGVSGHCRTPRGRMPSA